MFKLSQKVAILGLLLIMCSSVTMAADVSEDTTNDITIPSTETIDETATEVVDTNCDM